MDFLLCAAGFRLSLRAMAAACYVCQGSATTQRSVSTVGTLGEPLGTCGLCSVFACGFHALRNTRPKRWECILCVLAHIAPPPPGGAGIPPSPGPIGGVGVVEEFEFSFAGADAGLVERMRDAVTNANDLVTAYYEAARAEGGLAAIPAIRTRDRLERMAVAIAIIDYTGVAQELLDPHLRQRPDLVGGVLTEGGY